MRKFRLSIITLSLGIALLPLAQAATTPAQEHLLEQVRLGEASHREDLVKQSLYRLELIDPNNPQLIAARMRYLLRQGDTDGAKKQLDRLEKLAPDSAELKSSRSEMNLNTGDGRQELQQARLLGVSGRVEEGVAAFEKLFGGVPPDQTLAIEYWALVARLPARHKEAVAQLKKLDASSPGNADLQAALAFIVHDAFDTSQGDAGWPHARGILESQYPNILAKARELYEEVRPVVPQSIATRVEYTDGKRAGNIVLEILDDEGTPTTNTEYSVSLELSLIHI